MKALLTSFLFAFCFAMPAGAYSTVDAQGRMVYICVRDRAYAYHSTPNCRALKKCQGHIKKSDYRGSLSARPTQTLRLVL